MPGEERASCIVPIQYRVRFDTFRVSRGGNFMRRDRDYDRVDRPSRRKKNGGYKSNVV